MDLQKQDSDLIIVQLCSLTSILFCGRQENLWSHTRHKTTFLWHHKGPVTSWSTDLIKWPNHPWDFLKISVHINTCNKESLTQRCHRSTPIWYFCILMWLESSWMTCVILHYKQSSRYRHSNACNCMAFPYLDGNTRQFAEWRCHGVFNSK